MDVSLPEAFNVQRKVRPSEGSASTSQRMRICSLRDTPYWVFCPSTQTGATVGVWESGEKKTDLLRVKGRGKRGRKTSGRVKIDRSSQLAVVS